jgi:tetratricopeptide (TPR) repeat protein
LDLSSVRRLGQTAPRLALEKIPFLGLAAVSSALTVKAQALTGTVWSLQHLPMGQRVTNALVQYILYLRKMFWPTDLAVFYPLGKSWPWEYVLVAVLLLIFISLIAIAFLKTKPYLIVGWLWYVGTLVPVIGFVQVGEQSAADRYTYITLTGIFIMVVWAAAEFFVKRTAQPSNSPALAPSLISLGIIAACILCTSRQLQYWRDSVSLFEHTEAVAGPNYIAEAGLGDLLSQQGRLDEARKYFESALNIQPKHPDILLGFGNLCFRQRDYKQAAESYKVVVQANPKQLDARFNLAVSLHAQGQIQPAIEHYQKALEIQPSLVRAHLNLAGLFMAQTNLDQAILHFKDASRLEPGNTEAVNGFAWAMLNHPDPKVRDGKQALRLAKEMCERTGNQHIGALNVYAAALAENHQFAEAIEMAQKALDLAKAAGQAPIAEEINKLQNFYKQNQSCRGK